MTEKKGRKGIVKSIHQTRKNLPPDINGAVHRILMSSSVRKKCRLTVTGTGQEERVAGAVKAYLDEIKGYPAAAKIAEYDEKEQLYCLKTDGIRCLVSAFKNALETVFSLPDGVITVGVVRRGLGLPDEVSGRTRKLGILEKKHVIIADSDGRNREEIAKFLKPHGVAAVKTNDSKDFFEQYNKKRPDLVFLNVELPSMKSSDILEWLKDMFGEANLPKVVILAPAGKENEAEEAIETGAVCAAAVPIVEEDLIIKVNTCFP